MIIAVFKNTMTEQRGYASNVEFEAFEEKGQLRGIPTNYDRGLAVSSKLLR